jgi:hypothetical protein
VLLPIYAILLIPTALFRLNLKKLKKIKGILVGLRGFEPPTTPTPRECATSLRYSPTPYAVYTEIYSAVNISHKKSGYMAVVDSRLRKS